MKKKTAQQELSKIVAHHRKLFAQEPKTTVSIPPEMRLTENMNMEDLLKAARNLNSNIAYRYRECEKKTEYEYQKINGQLYELRNGKTDNPSKTLKYLQNEFADMLHSINMALAESIDQGSIINKKTDAGIEE